MKKAETHTSNDLKRYLGILHEEHMATIKAISEQFVDVNRKLGGMDRRFDSVDQKLDSHTKMIGKLAEDVEIIKSDIGIIKTDLKQKVDRTEFATLERRVLRLESKVR